MGKPEANANQLETVFNFLVEPVLVFNAEAKVQRINPAATEAFGFDPVGISLASLAEELTIRYPGDRAMLLDEFPASRALKGETVVGERFVFTNRRGYDHIVEASAIPLMVGGEVAGAVSVWHDITTREAALEDIRESRRQVLDILESISDGFFALDNLWRFTYINQRAQQLLQLRKEYVLYANIWDKLPQAVNTGLYNNLQRAMREGKPASFEEFYAPVERWFDVHAYPYENGLSVYFSDITQRKKAEEQQERTRQLGDALNSINAAINSTLDFDEIMKRVVVDAAKAIGCETSSIDIRDGHQWTIKYLFGLPPELIGTTATDEEAPLAVLAARTRQPIVVSDAYDDPRVNPKRIRRFNLRSILALPLTIKDEVVGALFFNYHSYPATFSDVEIDFASKLASSVSLALANAKLYSAAQEELSRTRVLQDVAIAATSSQDLKAIANEVLEALCRHMHVTSGEVRVLDRKRQVLSRLASLNFPQAELLEGVELETVRPLKQVDLDSKRYLIIPIDFREQILGSLALVFDKHRKFSENELQVFHAVAHIIGQAIDSTYLHESRKRTQ